MVQKRFREFFVINQKQYALILLKKAKMIVSCRTVFVSGITTHVFYYDITTSY